MNWVGFTYLIVSETHSAPHTSTILRLQSIADNTVVSIRILYFTKASHRQQYKYKQIYKNYLQQLKCCHIQYLISETLKRNRILWCNHSRIQVYVKPRLHIDVFQNSIFCWSATYDICTIWHSQWNRRHDKLSRQQQPKFFRKQIYQVTFRWW